MILLYQITHSNTDYSLLDLFMTASVATTRGHNFKFLSHVVILVVASTPFLAELLIIGITYPPVLSMLTQLIPLKTY